MENHIYLDLRTYPNIFKIGSDEKFIYMDEYPYHCISNYGQCYSEKSDQILRPQLSGTGYHILRLMPVNSTEHEDVYIHHLVAKYFVRNPLQTTKDIVHHRDFSPLNNYYRNLMWVTKAEHELIHQGKRLYISRDKGGKWKPIYSYDALAGMLYCTPAEVRSTLTKPLYDDSRFQVFDYWNREGKYFLIALENMGVSVNA